MLRDPGSKWDLRRDARFSRSAQTLLAGDWRMRVNVSTMLNQSKTVFQAEIDSACELIDFWRFNCHYARGFHDDFQPLVSQRESLTRQISGLSRASYSQSPHSTSRALRRTFQARACNSGLHQCLEAQQELVLLQLLPDEADDGSRSFPPGAPTSFPARVQRLLKLHHRTPISLDCTSLVPQLPSRAYGRKSD